ncbi:MAG TPA: heme biosynthesis protein HemY, partial [Thiomicrospira sp.]|nr:heme biosynthesis protein HemY [Thiomicrospira sp.]
IKKQWNDRLVYQYGRISLGPAFERLKIAEKWRTADPARDNNPVLLLTLGRLACKSQLWAMGQSYLKQSLKIQAEVETFHALAQCYEAEGKENQAALTYKEAILQLENK